ncbi:SDR family oxidoreductase [Kineosporia succinea]|uniref:NAD(P)-dependent dehydrogenase (Short-subunit alcohol dehydrogenase family) n=1 Tax=Kineosporia succinea TaxID=84632 RepID=A0ABT9P207_9ACTN|nr:SDR family oxidoreductase [Kineosporia succinea]MDP9826708.1 NAD(P)-dependent dehydrogenase (short-subunit alcohol dehydrogenase family) [Kineosporia succinea]
MQITDTAAIVTGAASGLGHATATALAAAGATVFGLDLGTSLEKAPEVEGVRYLEVDVTDPDAVEAAVTTASTIGIPLRTVVNCAGIGSAARILGKKGRHDIGLYTKVVQVNLIGTFTVLTYAAERIAQTEPDETGARGVIINTASVAAFEGQVGQAAYSSSKGGVVGLCLPAARDLAQYGIRVNTIAPGTVETPMLAGVTEEYLEGLAAAVPFPRRLARPDEYAKLALMLVDHDYINGETVRMDGAIRMPPR